MKIKYQNKSEFQHKDDKNYDKDNEDKKEFNWMFILFFFNNKKFHLGNNWCLLLKIFKYIKNESKNKNL